MAVRGVVLLVLVGAACGRSKSEPEHKPVPAASADAVAPRDAAVKTIDDLPAEMRATLPTFAIEADTEGLLAYVAERLVAPSSLAGRAATAHAIVVGTVIRSDVLDHKPSKAFLADADLRGRAQDGPGGLVLFVNLVEMRVEKWLRGSGGKTVRVVWESPVEDDGTTPSLPDVDERGILIVHTLPKTTLGRELAASARGAYAIVAAEPVIVPDEGGALAVALGTKPTSTALAKSLAELRGAALQVQLGTLLASPPKDLNALLAERIRAGEDDVETLLVRAALFRRGDRERATAGLDAMTMNAETLEALNIVVLEKSDQRLGLSGPEPTTPLPLSE